MFVCLFAKIINDSCLDDDSSSRNVREFLNNSTTRSSDDKTNLITMFKRRPCTIEINNIRTAFRLQILRAESGHGFARCTKNVNAPTIMQ